MEETYVNAILVFILITVLTFLLIDFADAYNSIVSKKIRKKQSGIKNHKERRKNVSRKRQIRTTR
jgi:hypothetical protein